MGYLSANFIYLELCKITAAFINLIEESWVLKKLFIISIGFLLFACSEPETASSKTSSVQNKTTQQTTSLVALFDFNKSQIKGDYLAASYYIETSANNVVLAGKMDCAEKSTNKMTCNAIADLNKLKPGIYRLLVRGGDGLLGSDLFEIQPGIVPVVITIDNESTGFYLISQITQQTGLREDEIYVRVKHILNSDDQGDYDLELTLCDLFVYYGAQIDYKQALKIMARTIKDNQPLPKRNQSHGVSETLKPLF